MSGWEALFGGQRRPFWRDPELSAALEAALGLVWGTCAQPRLHHPKALPLSPQGPLQDHARRTDRLGPTRFIGTNCKILAASCRSRTVGTGCPVGVSAAVGGSAGPDTLTPAVSCSLASVVVLGRRGLSGDGLGEGAQGRSRASGRKRHFSLGWCWWRWPGAGCHRDPVAWTVGTWQHSQGRAGLRGAPHG